MMGLFGFGGAGVFGMLLMGLFWVGLFLVLLWAVSRFFPRERRRDAEIARELVSRRYAAGEISEAEYQQALRALTYD